MKLYILTPSPHRFSESNLNALKNVYSEIKFVTNTNDIQKYEFDEGSVIALDADFYEWNFRGEVLSNFSRIKAIAIDSTSFSWIDTKFFSDRYIPIVNTRRTVKDSVAEWAIMCMFMLSRKIPLLMKNNFPPLEFDKYAGIEIEGKTAGIIGMGNIGQSLAMRLRGLGLKVIYWSKNSICTDFNKVEIEELFRNSDFIFPALALNDETKNLITKEYLKNMKSSASFISIVHDMYDHKFLLEQVKNERIYGYAFESDDNKLQEFEGNVLCLPAYAWDTNESSQKMSNMWTENLINITKNYFPTKIN